MGAVGGRAAWIALAIALLSLSPREARADDELATCTTVTQRTADEIFVSINQDPGQPKGVTLLPGETLCLAGELDEADRLHARLADSEKDERPVLLLRLQPTGDGATLHALTNLEGFLDLVVWRVQGRARLTTFERHIASRFLPPGRPVDAPLQGSRVLLAPVRVERPGNRGDMMITDGGPSWRRAHYDYVSTGFLDVTVSGLLRRVAVDGFDGVLRASGYAPLPRTFAGGSLELGMEFDRWRVRIDVTDAWASSTAHGGGHVGASLFGGSFEMGYDFVRWRGLTGFVLGGLAESRFRVDARAPGFDLLGPQAAALGNPGSVRMDAMLVAAEAGLEEVVPLGHSDISGGVAGAIYFFLRGGYDRQLFVDTWKAPPSQSVHGMPDFDPSGLWVSLGVGIGLGGDEPAPRVP
jgi:hypothetical protein